MLLLVVLAAVTSYFMGDAVLMFFTVLLFAAPAMAVYYLAVCFAETRAINTGSS
jgi:hypothetical protein